MWILFDVLDLIASMISMVVQFLWSEELIPTCGYCKGGGHWSPNHFVLWWAFQCAICSSTLTDKSAAICKSREDSWKTTSGVTLSTATAVSAAIKYSSACYWSSFKSSCEFALSSGPTTDFHVNSKVEASKLLPCIHSSKSVKFVQHFVNCVIVLSIHTRSLWSTFYGFTCFSDL